MAHVYGAYMTVGIGEVCANLFRDGTALAVGGGLQRVAFTLVFRPAYGPLETIFKIFLGLLGVSFVGSAIFVGASPLGVLQGLYRIELPDAAGRFNPLLVGTAMIGAVGGSIMNLAYPYFLDAKGWRGPQYRRVQTYDLLLGIVAMVVLNLAVWTLGAELLYPDRQIHTLDDLPALVSTVLGEWGRALFYLGIFAAIYTSILGHATGLGMLGTHAWLRWRGGSAADASTAHVAAACRVSRHRHLVAGLAARLDAARHAGLRDAHADRQRRAGRHRAARRRRPLAHHRQLSIHRRTLPRASVGKRGDGAAVRAGALRRVPLGRARSSALVGS